MRARQVEAESLDAKSLQPRGDQPHQGIRARRLDSKMLQWLGNRLQQQAAIRIDLAGAALMNAVALVSEKVKLQ